MTEIRDGARIRVTIDGVYDGIAGVQGDQLWFPSTNRMPQPKTMTAIVGDTIASVWVARAPGFSSKAPYLVATILTSSPA
ncbi:hypothetical protein [uncultured Sphingomonas sp.]|uniref:hypothetical protein n=1 Tax=uncultured Sphingomonas sp. TaxID=158754 RepID=UPI00260DBE76|nr:hypothetical protein [uncultured Sphingomonas sp.]